MANNWKMKKRAGKRLGCRMGEEKVREKEEEREGGGDRRSEDLEGLRMKGFEGRKGEEVARKL